MTLPNGYQQNRSIQLSLSGPENNLNHCFVPEILLESCYRWKLYEHKLFLDIFSIMCVLSFVPQLENNLLCLSLSALSDSDVLLFLKKICHLFQFWLMLDLLLMPHIIPFFLFYSLLYILLISDIPNPHL